MVQNSVKVCGIEVVRFIDKAKAHPNSISVEGAQIILPQFGFHVIKWEEGRVDAIAVYQESKVLMEARIEFKFISFLDRNPSTLLREISKTKNQVKKKKLDFLVIMS